MSRSVQVVILCEDRQHEAFARRFLSLAGRGVRVQRVVLSPKGRGSGEQFVRLKYAEELSYFRSRKHHIEQALLVVIDADKKSVQERIDQIESECAEAGHHLREAGERVAIIVAGRNIETWIAYLDGQTVNEKDVYPRLEREKDCKRHVETLFEMCQRQALRQPAPLSLEAACIEYQKRIR